jgi:hypothetical protein
MTQAEVVRALVAGSDRLARRAGVRLLRRIQAELGQPIYRPIDAE